jgi:HEPN domain-containing protein
MTQDDAARCDAVAQWLLRAQADLDYAVLGAKAGHIHPNLICFHLQQCTEKALKAVLMNRGLGVPRTHDLTDLAARLVGVEPALPAMGLLSVLSPFGSVERYPSTGDVPGPMEVEAFKVATVQVLDWAKSATKT